MEKLPAEAAELEVADAIGQLLEFWGFKRPMGRIWALLYLSPGPLTAGAIGGRLRMSAGSVSMTLAELAKWGAIRKTWRPGERPDYYEPETSVWTLVTRVLRQRELGLARQVIESLETAAHALPRSAKSKRRRDALDFKRKRIETLQRWMEVGERLLHVVDAGGLVDSSMLRQVAEDSR
jgi:DNA-binding transcriptional regulator GbsR (MarR family)